MATDGHVVSPLFFPGGDIGMWLIGGLGFLGSLLAFVLSTAIAGLAVGALASGLGLALAMALLGAAQAARVSSIPVQRPIHPSPERLDRLLHASAAPLTRGLSPVSLSLAWADWAWHLAVSPGRQMELAAELVDADPWALNTSSGIVDLRTGAVSPHAPAALISRSRRRTLPASINTGPRLFAQP